MTGTRSGGRVTLAICAAAVIAGSMGRLGGQQPPGTGQGRGAGRGGGGGIAGSLFTALDTNGDASLTRDELKTMFDKWYMAADRAGTGASQDQIAAALSAAMPQPVASALAAGSDPCGGRSAQPQVPCPADVDKMMAALPDKAPAKPKQPRRVLVLAKASGFVHSSIPLAARMMEEMGKKTGAWTATVSYDPAVITADTLEQYDAIFLDNTTGTYLDDPNDAAVTAARRKALLEFVRGGKGLAAIHAAIDSYHGNPANTGRGGGPGRGGAGSTLALQIVAQGDTNHDQRISRAEMAALADAWFDKLDPEKTGKVSQQDFAARFMTLFAVPAAAGGGQAVNAGLWPEYNKMIGAWFKFHWNDPQLIVVKIDDPKSPLTAPFHGQPFEIRDETYTYPMESFSRQNVHVLTSVDYSKMSEEDKAKEPAASKRTDGDYALSWIRRDGKGRVFVEAHGHSERVYAIRPMLEHVLAGVQYALGDLQADDAPSAKGTTTRAAK